MIFAALIMALESDSWQQAVNDPTARQNTGRVRAALIY
ncbi:Transcriptional regulator, TetR family [Pseudomonas mediterranea]